MDSCDLISDHQQKTLDAVLLAARLKRGVARFHTASERRIVLMAAAGAKLEQAKLSRAELVHSRKRSQGERCPSIKFEPAA